MKMKSAQNDMTVGNPMKIILSFTFPIFLGNVFQQFYNMADAVVVGKFVGNTTQARFVSESHNDFIFAIIIEEGGVILGLVIIILYLILLYRGIQVARRSKGYFGAFCAIGLTIMIVFQALINMFVATGITPVTGQTLPFISYGGTSFLFSCIALGIVLSISAEANKDQEKVSLEQDIIEEDSPESDSESETQEAVN